MHAITTAAVVATLACSAHSFTVGPAAPAGVAAARPSTGALNARLSADDFVPSETWMREYFGQDGLRYNLNKADAEIEKEGDYNIFEAIFGATSNNAAKMKLKAEARKKAKVYSNEQESQFWLQKYGHPRFYPAYVDKSGENELPAEAASPMAAAQAAVAAPAKSIGGLFKKKLPEPEMAKAVPAPILPLPIPAKVAPTVIKGGRSGPSTPYETNPGNPRDLPGKVTTVSKAAAPAPAKKASSAPKAAKVIAAKVAAAPAAASATAGRASRAASRTAAKAKGNLSNLPKRLSK